MKATRRARDRTELPVLQDAALSSPSARRMAGRKRRRRRGKRGEGDPRAAAALPILRIFDVHPSVVKHRRREREKKRRKRGEGNQGGGWTTRARAPAFALSGELVCWRRVSLVGR